MQAEVEGFRLSPQQERLWLLVQRDGAAYGAECAVELPAAVDAARLAEALRRLIDRHEVLRSRFERLPGMLVPVQVIGDETGTLAFREEELADEEALAARLAEVGGAADGVAGGVMRATLLRPRSGLAVLHLVLPVLAADARTLANLLGELGELYGGRAVDEEPVQYLQFSEWQSELLDDPEATATAYWQEREPAFAAVARLPFERASDAGAPYAPRALPLALAPGLAARAEALGTELGVEPAVLAQTAWQVLLARYAGGEASEVAYLWDGREHELLAGALGLFAKWLPARLALPAGAGFGALAREAQGEREAAHEPAAVFLWGGSREAAQDPRVFPAFAFELSEWPQAPAGTPLPWRLRQLASRFERAKLRLALWRRDGEWTGELVYDASLYDAADVARLGEAYGELLAAALAAPETPWSRLPLLAAPERQRLVVEVNPQTAGASPADPGDALHRRFERMAAQWPENSVLACEGRVWTAAEANRAANRLAHRLRRLGVGPEVPVALGLPRSGELVIALLGILKAGGAYVPLEPSLPPSRLALMLEEVGAPVLITTSELAPRFAAFRGTVLALDRAELDGEGAGLAGESDADLGLPVAGEQLAYVIFTSGSTGRPKGVGVEHRQLLHYLDGVMARLALPAGGTYATVSTFAADLGNTSVLPALATGGSLHVLPTEVASDAEALAAYFERHPVDVLKIVPSHLEALTSALPDPARLLPRQCLVLGGEAARPTWVETLLAAGRAAHGEGWRLYNHYGPSETTVGVLTHTVVAGELDPRCGSLPLGRPLPGSRVYLLDRHAEPVPRWMPGEVFLGGGGVSRGYVGRPGQTAERFVPDPFAPAPGARLYRTGDQARFLPGGEVEFLGRIDRQVKFHGFRIELDEIRSLLNRHPQVRDSAVVLRQDETGHNVLVAFYVSRQEIPVAELRAFLGDLLPAEVLPNLFAHLRRLPLNLNGKVSYEALPPLLEIRRQEEQSGPAPLRTPTQEILAGLWREVLNRERIGANDSFFDLGGHSLIATQLISRVRQVFQVEVPLRSLFDHPTLAGLAGSVDEHLRRGEPLTLPPLVAVPRQAEVALSFAQERLWFMHRLDPASAAYNIPVATRARGPLDVRALAGALARLGERHEVLRTRFRERDGVPFAVVDARAALPFTVVDLSHRDAAVGAAEIVRLAAREALRPFDLAAEPPLRVALLRLGPAEHVVLATVHHIAFDAWSAEVFVREISALYDGLAAGRSSTLAAALAPLALQYADYAAWQRSWLAGETMAKELAYWQRQLAGAPEELALPTDHPRREVPSFHGAVEVVPLPPELAKAIADLARGERATVFMVLLAAFEALLYRLTGQTDLVVGTDVANRHHLEVEGLIGFFVNNLVLRTDLGGEPSFRELVRRVRETTLEAYAHQELPFDRLVKALKPRRELARMPLFQVLFVLQNTPAPGGAPRGVAFEPLDLATQRVKFDLALFFREGPDGVTGAWSYNRDLFEPATVRRLAGQFTTLLASACQSPDARLDQLEMSTAMEKEERQQSSLGKLKGIRQRAAERPNERPGASLVKSGPLVPGGAMPLLVEPNVPDLDLVGWAAGHREWVEGELARAGALLFRGFGIERVADFQRFAASLCDDLYGEYGDLPREQEAEKVYHSTPYPPDKTILFHNESSHMHRWPLKQWFFCVQAAEQGGETPLVDGRRVLAALDPEIVATFAAKQLLYVRNFIPGFDVSWQDFFHTTDRGEVERVCREAGLDIVWRGDGLETRQLAPAVVRHPKTGERVFFNQVQLHHPYCLEPEVRESMATVFADGVLPRNVLYGDGTAIPDAVMEAVLATYWDLAVAAPWQNGDIVMLDNMLVSHARNPYSGRRKIVVAMGEIFQGRELGSEPSPGEPA